LNFRVLNIDKAEFWFESFVLGVRLIWQIEMKVIVFIQIKIRKSLGIHYLVIVFILTFKRKHCLFFNSKLNSLPQIVIKKLLFVLCSLASPLNSVLFVVLNNHVVSLRVDSNSVAVPSLVFDLKFFIQAIWVYNSDPAFSKLTFFNNCAVIVPTDHHLIVIHMVNHLESVYLQILAPEPELLVLYLYFKLVLVDIGS